MNPGRDREILDRTLITSKRPGSHRNPVICQPTSVSGGHYSSVFPRRIIEFHQHVSGKFPELKLVSLSYLSFSTLCPALPENRISPTPERRDFRTKSCLSFIFVFFHLFCPVFVNVVFRVLVLFPSYWIQAISSLQFDVRIFTTYWALYTKISLSSPPMLSKFTKGSENQVYVTVLPNMRTFP